MLWYTWCGVCMIIGYIVWNMYWCREMGGNGICYGIVTNVIQWSGTCSVVVLAESGTGLCGVVVLTGLDCVVCSGYCNDMQV